MEIPKTPKMKNAEKKKTDILTRAISTVVFTDSVFFFFFCVSLNFAVKIGVSAPPPQKKIKGYIFKVRNWSKLKLKTGPSILCNKTDEF